MILRCVLELWRANCPNSSPQPEGWGICGRRAASLVGWTEASPTSPGWVFTPISYELGRRENVTPPTRKLSVKLSIDTHLLYGYSCGVEQIEIQFHLPARTKREI